MSYPVFKFHALAGLTGNQRPQRGQGKAGATDELSWMGLLREKRHPCSSITAVLADRCDCGRIYRDVTVATGRFRRMKPCRTNGSCWWRTMPPFGAAWAMR